MAWCHQATSHYLCQCWPSSMSSYGVTRPQWVKVANMHHLYKIVTPHSQLWTQWELDMSTARRHLKSPQSLYGTSTHPTMVTHRWLTIMVINDRLTALFFCVNQCPTPIPQIRLFQTLTFKLQGQGHGCGQRAVSNWFAFFLFHINQIAIPQIQLFWNLTLKNQRSRPWVRSKVKVT